MPRKKPVAANPGDDNPKLVEWIIAGLSAAVTVLLFSYLSYDALTADDAGPNLRVVVGATNQPVAGYVQVTLVNDGDRSAAAVEVEGVVKTGADAVTSLVTLDFSPAHSSVTATLVFPEPVDAGDVAVRVTGFTDP